MVFITAKKVCRGIIRVRTRRLMNIIRPKTDTQMPQTRGMQLQEQLRVVVQKRLKH